jgi:hypothetical protein
LKYERCEKSSQYSSVNHSIWKVIIKVKIETSRSNVLKER